MGDEETLVDLNYVFKIKIQIMFEPNLSIDVSLLAIILGLYATKNDRNLILVLICFLFAHVLLTNDDDDCLVVEDVSVDERSSVQDFDAVGVAAAAPVPVTETPQTDTADSFKTTLSSGVFDRQLSTPQTNLTSTVFPATSVEANGKLASARDSFFKSLVS